MPVPGRLGDTTLELVGPGGTIAINDNWRTGGQEADIIASTLPPTRGEEGGGAWGTLPEFTRGGHSRPPAGRREASWAGVLPWKSPTKTE